ncbi:hypothetical protein QAD02_018465 [Eretmocerus hayati]|uniref:Uncharacterized protein n=1 Tax=Eretmocerus hayati TaxID=131215 RepID=A0ACC2PGS3_9HYME|nr:hypothetical protein QAD02_018465 [Eretmocerus hayati]
MFSYISSFAWLFIQISANQDEILNSLLVNIRRYVSPYKVNMIIDDINQLSPLATRIIQRINQDFASNIILAEDILQEYETNVTENQPIDYSKTDYYLKRMPERVSLLMGIAVFKNQSNVVRKMKTMLNYLNAYNPLIRGNYLIHLITEQRIDLKFFFQLAWSMKFLDLTVIEWTPANSSDSVGVHYIGNSYYHAHMHNFNPFLNTLESESFDGQNELFPKKVQNCYGYTVLLWSRIPYVSKSQSVPTKSAPLRKSSTTHQAISVTLIQTLLEVMNCSLGVISVENISVYEKALPLRDRVSIDLFDVPLYEHDYDPNLKNRWEVYHRHQLTTIHIPLPKGSHFYVLREKMYSVELSFAAIGIFATLFLTAFIFAVWAKILGFRVRDWSFLEIFTAQMGGSIFPRGQMKLSEKIFLMAIYIATFIIVTIGTDYMLEIFIVHQELPDIKTIQDIADLNMTLRVDWYTSYILSIIARVNPSVEIFERLKAQMTIHGEGAYADDSFCRLRTTDAPNLEEAINFCIVHDSMRTNVASSNHRFQVDKIEDSVRITLPQFDRIKLHSFFKDYFQELTYKFLEVGLLHDYEKFRIADDVAFPDQSIEDHGIQEVSPQAQLYPILVVGYTVGIAGLILEFVWKLFISKSELGRLLEAFFRRRT